MGFLGDMVGSTLAKNFWVAETDEVIGFRVVNFGRDEQQQGRGIHEPEETGVWRVSSDEPTVNQRWVYVCGCWGVIRPVFIRRGALSRRSNEIRMQ